jgi:hypothetical protein
MRTKTSHQFPLTRRSAAIVHWVSSILRNVFSFAPRPIRRGAIFLFAAGLLAAGANTLHAAVSGVFGGGPLYINAANKINELKNAGFEEVIVWNIMVKANGDLNFNGEFLICSNGSYVGDALHPDFAGNMAILKQGTVKRVTFSVGSSNFGDWQNIRNLVNAQGTGSTSILYRNFQALKKAIPALDAIDFDDENSYDQSSMIKFSVMLGSLGYKVALCPYTNASFWTSVASQVNSQRPGTIDTIHLQCYDGGGGNDPCSWDFGDIPVYPGVWNRDSASTVQSKMTNWRQECGVSGGWMWLYDQFIGNASSYANAINNGIGNTVPGNGTYKLVSQKSGLALDASGGGTANGTPLVQWPYNGGNNQRWTLASLGSGQYRLTGVASGRTINVEGASLNNGAGVILYDWRNENNAKFTLVNNGMGYYSLRFVHSGKAMTVLGASTAAGASIIQYDYNGGWNARWRFVSP